MIALAIVGVVALVAAFVLITFFFNLKKKQEDAEEGKDKKEAKKPTPKPVEKNKDLKPSITKEQKEEKKKQEVSRRIAKLSELGLERSKEVIVNEDPNGTEAVGVVFNEKSKVYMFGPKGYKLNSGDVVIVLDASDVERTVPVVSPNKFVRNEDLVQPFKDIVSVVYQVNGGDIPAEEPVEEIQEEETQEVVEEQQPEKAPVEEVAPVVEEPKFTITFDNQGHGEQLDPLTDLENMPDALPLLSEEGFEFNGWYLDQAFEKEAEFDSKLESDLVLYAKWTEVVKEPEVVEEQKPEEAPAEEPALVEEVAPVVEAPKYTISFDNQGHGEALDPLTDLENMPDALPLLSEEGFEFGGWYLDLAFEKEAEFDVKLESDLVLYAKWTEVVKEPEVVEEPKPVEEAQEEAAEEDDADDEEEEEAEESESAGPQETTVVEFDETEKKYHIIKTKKTYEAKISYLAKETKEFYDILRNKFMSYDVKHSQTKTAEKFKVKRDTLAILKVSGKQAAIYLALDPKELDASKYVGKDLSDKKAYQATPFQYKTRTERKTKWALELIEMWAEKNNLALNPDHKDEKYAVNYPAMTEEELIAKGYLTKTEVISDVPPKGFVKFKEIEVPVEKTEEENN